MLAGMEWPFGSEVSAAVVARWMRACGWEVQVQGPEDALVTVRRTVRLSDEVDSHACDDKIPILSVPSRLNTLDYRGNPNTGEWVLDPG